MGDILTDLDILLSTTQNQSNNSDQSDSRQTTQLLNQTLLYAVTRNGL